MMRNWLTAFRPASFRGVGFEVEIEDAEGGRRLGVSPIAYSDRHIDEDQGGQPQRVTLTAYVVGDLADQKARALMGALQRPGPGTLVMPMLGASIARAPSWRLSRDKRRAGYVAFDVEFVLGGLGSAGFATVPAAARISAAMMEGAAILGSAVSWSLRSVSPGRGDHHAASAILVASRLANLAPAIQAGSADAAMVTDAAQTIVRYASTPVENAVPIAAMIVSTVQAVAERGPAGRALSEALTPDATSVEPFAAAAAAAFAAGYCLALARRDFAARQDARAAREQISPVVDPVLAVVADWLNVAVYGWLSDIAAICAQELSDIAANLSPVVRVETGVSLPATLAAYMIYGEVDRAEELALRNAAATPAMMPVSFEAVAA